MLTKEIACSHLRAWAYFLESIRTTNESCKFIAWPCPQGTISYTNGMCFPMESTLWSQEMGYRANRGPLGIYYLPTRDQEPFCGKVNLYVKYLQLVFYLFVLIRPAFESIGDNFRNGDKDIRNVILKDCGT